MKKFGLSFVGLSLVSSVGTFAVGENAGLNVQIKAKVDEYIGLILDFLTAVSRLFDLKYPSTNFEKRKNVIESFNKLFDFMIKCKNLSSEEKQSVESYYKERFKEVSLYAKRCFPFWFNVRDFCARDESLIPKEHRDNYYFLRKFVESIELELRKL